MFVLQGATRQDFKRALEARPFFNTLIYRFTRLLRRV